MAVWNGRQPGPGRHQPGKAGPFRGPGYRNQPAMSHKRAIIICRKTLQQSRLWRSISPVPAF